MMEKFVPVDVIENAVPFPSGPPLEVNPVKTSCACTTVVIHKRKTIMPATSRTSSESVKNMYIKNILNEELKMVDTNFFNANVFVNSTKGRGNGLYSCNL